MAIRDIIFRGKRLDNGEWVEGFYVHTKRHHCIITGCIDDGYVVYGHYASDVAMYVVDPSTVGQYTGLCDRDGKKIFEGDIVNILGNQESADWKNVNYNALIAFLDGGFCAIDGTIENHGFRRYALARMDFDLEVIGNIHDNPELLEGEG